MKRRHEKGGYVSPLFFAIVCALMLALVAGFAIYPW